MEGTGFDDMLKKIKPLHKLAGLALDSSDTKRSDKIKLRLLYIFNFIWLYCDIIIGIFWLKDGIKHKKTITELTFIAPAVANSFLGTFKSICHLHYENLSNQLITCIRKSEKQMNVTANDEINEGKAHLNHVINILNFFSGGLVVVFAVSPLVLMAVKYFMTGQVELMLPFLDIYPFDSLNLRYWPFVYVHQIWSECVVLLDICCADYFFYICCTYIRIQFRLIQHEFENLISCKSAGRVRYSDQEFRDKFINLIKWHQEVISSVDMLEIIYAKSTLFNFLASSIVICFTGFNVTTIDDLTFVVVFMTFLFMSLFQIYFLCFFGDLLMRSSMDVCDAVYKCSWYLADAGIRKDIVVIQIRAQKPCKLTAFGFSDVNLNAFMRVLSTSWSYFALLQTVYG